ncbi:MAG: PAS domain S-box protein, partial [Bacillota bacterium]|nr:PAS domain S-box protein [Bacillota bacterium]
DAFAVVKLDGTIKHINPMFCKSVGCDPEEIVGEPALQFVNDFVHQDDLQETNKVVREAFQGVIISNFENRYINKDGSYQWFEWTLTPLVEKGLLYAVGHNITERRQIEESLRLSEERFRKGFNSSSSMMVISRLKDNAMVEVNDRFLRSMGYSRKEVIGRTASEIKLWSNPKQRDKIIISMLFKQQPICDLEVNFNTKSGEVCVSLLSAELIELDGDKCLLISLTDITERKQIEDRLLKTLTESQQREAEVKALFEATRSVLKCQDYKSTTKEIFYSCLSLVGATAGYMMLWDNNQCYDVQHIELGGQNCTCDLQLPSTIRGIKTEVYNSKKAVYNNDFVNCEWQELIPEGHVRIDNVLYAPLMLNNKVIGFLVLGNKPGGFSDNDTELISVFCELIAIVLHNNQTLESLKASEERFFKAFNLNPSPMALESLEDDLYIDVNDSYTRMFGYNRDEILGHTSMELNLWENPNKRTEVIKVLEEQGSLRNIEANILTKSRSIRKGLFSAELITVNGQKCILKTLNDITELRQLEKEMARLDRLNLVGEMAAGIAHEVRNPMTTVRGFLQLLGCKEECAKFKSQFDLMVEEMDSVNSIITEYLSVAKNRVIEVKPTNLNAILEAMLPLLKSDAIKSSNYITLELEETSDLLLNEGEIRQVIFNLVRNGLEASPGTGLIIRIFNDGEEIVLAVQDKGKGISPNVLEKIGTPFFTTKDNGTGLGLAVCYSIAARHNAKIEIQTNKNGTTFFIRFKQTAPRVKILRFANSTT